MHPLLIAVVLSLFSLLPCSASIDGTDNLSGYFQGYDTVFVLKNLKTGEVTGINLDKSGERMSPCSTFKIFNSLVGLETGVLKSENDAMKWDGTEYSIKSWNRDQTLQSAVTNSCLWYFQAVARKIGSNRMRKFVDKTPYGNKDISAGIDRFWLGSSLKISPDEQVSLLIRLINDELPFSKRSMAIVRGMLRLEQTPKGTLYGKTGSDMKDGKKVLGWFVGYLVQPDCTYVFATKIRAADGAWGPEARKITRQILSDMDLL